MKLALFTLQLGWGPRSGISVANTATILSDVFDENSKAYELGKLAYFQSQIYYSHLIKTASLAVTLTDKYTPNSTQAYITTVIGSVHVLALGHHHLRDGIPHLTRAYNQLLRAGEKVCIALSFIFQNCLLTLTY